MEKKERNVEITRKKLSKEMKVSELCIEYKTTASNINRIVSDTQAKYPELFVEFTS